MEIPPRASALQLSGGLCGCREAVVVQLPDMLFQVEVAAETLAAGGTGEGLLVVMRVHVEGQIVDLMEGFVADGALVLLLAAVSQFMVLVVSWAIQKRMSIQMSGSEEWFMLEKQNIKKSHLVSPHKKSCSVQEQTKFCHSVWLSYSFQTSQFSSVNFLA